MKSAARPRAVLFPLPLTPFERYYLADDRPEYPTTFPVELRFSGELDPKAFEAALRAGIARHPLLGALVADGRRGPQWVAGHEQPPAVDWADESGRIAHADGEYIDLRRDCGLRVWVRTSPGAARVLFQLHHACCDGLASTQFIDDLLVLYARAAREPEPSPSLPEPRVERLRDRAVLEGVPAKVSLPALLRDVVITGILWSLILFRRVKVVAAPRQTPADDQAQEILALETYRLSPEEAEGYRGVAAAHGVTANDLLVRDLFLAVGDWNRAQGDTSRAACRINVPVNVRGRESADIPASNRIGFAFVTAANRALRDRTRLLALVRRQTRRIKDWKLAFYFLGGLSAAAGVPGVVPAILRCKKTFATIVLSNVGRVLANSRLPRRDGKLDCGGAVLEQITGVPPIRENTRAAIIVIEYGGATMISLRTDARYFGRRATRALLDTYLVRLRETIELQS